MSRQTKFTGLSVCLLLLATLNACTLDSKVYDQAPSEQFPKTEAELLSTVSSAYTQLSGYGGDVFNLNGPSSDEIVVPTRGPDWDDQGAWRSIETHTWTPDRPGSLNGAWEFGFQGVVNANLGIGRIQNATLQLQGKETLIAELRVLRAFYYYVLCDMFGNVPIITETSKEQNPAQKTRAQVFTFIESELKAAIPNLRSGSGVDLYGRMTKGVAFTLLAKVYLNAQVFAGTPRWADAIIACDSVIKSGNYVLNPDFLNNFSVGNRNSANARRENIMVVPYDKVNQGGNNFQMRTLHYAQQREFGLPQSPWNGFCTISEFYNSFPDGDVRKGMWMVGPQKGANGSVIKYNDAITGENNVDLSFQPSITSLARATQRDGIRSQKYEIQRGNSTTDQDNHFAIFRYADVLMMKAEAAFRLGQADGLPLINQVRARAGLGDLPTLSLDVILAERGREFAWENLRRNDLIRFNKFAEGTWQFKPASPKSKELFPVPTQQLARNPNLKQNTGY